MKYKRGDDSVWVAFHLSDMNTLSNENVSMFSLI